MGEGLIMRGFDLGTECAREGAHRRHRPEEVLSDTKGACS